MFGEIKDGRKSYNPLSGFKTPADWDDQYSINILMTRVRLSLEMQSEITRGHLKRISGTPGNHESVRVFFGKCAYFWETFGAAMDRIHITMVQTTYIGQA